MTKREYRYFWRTKPMYKIDTKISYEVGLVNTFGAFGKVNKAIICLTEKPKLEPLRGTIVFRKENRKYIPHGIIF